MVAFPPAPAGGHQVRNRADEPARVVIVSTMLQPEVAEYPDSGKIVAPRAVHWRRARALLELPLRKDDAVGYWEGDAALADGSADDSR